MSISTLRVDDNYDLFLPDGANLALVDGLAACNQSILQATSMRLRENQFDLSDGVPYFETVFANPRDYDLFRAYITKVTEAVPDVEAVTEVNISQIGEILEWSANVDTIYGSIVVSETSINVISGTFQ